MTETVKKIIKELAKEPFKKSFSVITFDSLKPDQLLQVLNDVLGEIDDRHKLDIREENVEDTAFRIIDALRVLKYKPPEENPSALRTGLLNGNAKVIHPILLWLLPKINELKTRAYLSKFLVKVDIPQEIRTDIEVEELYQQYEEMIEEFKKLHKQLESMKSKGFTTSEIRKDIEAMENEQESVTRKIEKLKRQTENFPELESTMKVVKEFRIEKEKSKEINEQRLLQNQGLSAAESKLSRLHRNLKDIKESNKNATPEGVLQRLEQDVDVNKYIVNQKFPQELENKEKLVALYQKVLSQTDLSQNELDELKSQIEDTKKDINDLVMKRMMKSEDNNLVMFRQQAAIVGNKKSSLVEKMNELKGELNGYSEDLTSKKKICDNLEGNAIVREEDFKDYVKSLRVKSTRYKQMKLEITALKAESNILSKTIFILEEQIKSSQMELSALEAQLGVQGFSSTQESLEKISSERSIMDEKKSKKLEEMTSTVQQITEQVEAKKVDLAPLVKSLNATRQQAQILSHEYDSQKKKYDVLVSSIRSKLDGVTQVYEELKKKSEENQLRIATMSTESEILQIDIKKMKDEMKKYASAGAKDRSKSYKEILQDNIAQLKKEVDAYLEEEKVMNNTQSQRLAQAKMWKDLSRLLQVKINEHTSGGST